MRSMARSILALLMVAMPIAALDAAPLVCTTAMAAAPMSCSGPACCCVEQGACLCPRPVSPLPPAAPAAPAVTSGQVDVHFDAQVASAWFEISIANFAERGHQMFALAPMLSSDDHLCVLQV